MRVFFLCLASLLIAIVGTGTAQACSPQVRIEFVENSPDYFRISFVHGPNLNLEKLDIRLDTSAAGAFFEGDSLAAVRAMPQTHPKAAGVQITSLRYEKSMVTIAILTFEGLLAGRVFDFYSDLDDLTRAGDPDGDHIADGELTGATATAYLVGPQGKRVEIAGRFGDKGVAVLGPRACV